MPDLEAHPSRSETDEIVSPLLSQVGSPGAISSAIAPPPTKRSSTALLETVEPIAPDRVVTSVRWPVQPQAAWQGMLYYEQIEELPPWFLRQLLPTPVRVTGPKAAPGDESVCEYQSGHLKKRITAVVPERSFEFEVLEQALHVGGVRLLGGSYEFSESGDSGTLVTLITRYKGGRRPRLVWRPVEAWVCHAFHRHILSAMRASIARRG